MTTHHIIPQEETTCVWFDANVIEYKLCDRQMECDKCPLHQSIQCIVKTAGPKEFEGDNLLTVEQVNSRMEIDPSIIIDGFLSSIPTNIFPKDRRYGKGHSWIMEQSQGKYRMGIDHIAASLLTDAVTIVEPQVPMRVERDSLFSWIVLWGGAVGLHSPIRCTVMGTNDCLKENPALLLQHPYSTGWVAEVDVSEIDDIQQHTLTSSAIGSMADEQLKKMGKTLKMAATKSFNSVGSTMLDGGIPIKSLQELIGGKFYLQLMNNFFKNV
jgi:glycine cleavage system H lipoate-binding protein